MDIFKNKNSMQRTSTVYKVSDVSQNYVEFFSLVDL